LIYLGDAIRKGFIKATVVNDLNTLDVSSISPNNRVTVGENALKNFRRHMTHPLAAMAAMKEAAK